MSESENKKTPEKNSNDSSLDGQPHLQHESRFDEDAFNKMVEKGTRAWSDVKDPAAWVEELRGGK